MKFKEENGLIYYAEDDKNEVIYDESGFSSGAGVVKKSKWKIAGRKNHPLTERFIKLLKGELDEGCSLCKGC